MKTIHSHLDFLGVSRITNLPAPAADTDAARLADVNAAIEGLSWKDSARVSTQGNINLSSPGAAIDGITLAAGDRVLVRAQTSVPANGIYIWNGAAVAMTRALDANTAAELENATLTVDEGTDAGTTWRQTQVNYTLGTNDTIFAAFGGSTPNASETTAGKAEIATQAETDTGTDDARIVTPLKLATYAGRKMKATANIGDGSATQYDVTHNFNTRDVTVEVFRNSGSYDSVLCDVGRPDANTVRLNFTVAPTSNQFRVVVIG